MNPYIDFLIIYVGPFLQAVTATLLLIYLLTLIFSYEELFGYTKPDEPVILTKKDFDQIQAKLTKDKPANDKANEEEKKESDIGFRLSEA